MWPENVLKTNYNGAPFSSVGRSRVPCAEALQRTWVRLPTWVPLLCVTPPLSLPVSCHIFSCSVNKAIKKILFDEKRLRSNRYSSGNDRTSNLGWKILSQRKALRISRASISIGLGINGQSMSAFFMWEATGKNSGFLHVDLPASRLCSQSLLPW